MNNTDDKNASEGGDGGQLGKRPFVRSKADIIREIRSRLSTGESGVNRLELAKASQAFVEQIPIHGALMSKERVAQEQNIHRELIQHGLGSLDGGIVNKSSEFQISDGTNRIVYRQSRVVEQQKYAQGYEIVCPMKPGTSEASYAVYEESKGKFKLANRSTGSFPPTVFAGYSGYMEQLRDNFNIGNCLERSRENSSLYDSCAKVKGSLYFIEAFYCKQAEKIHKKDADTQLVFSWQSYVSGDQKPSISKDIHVKNIAKLAKGDYNDFYKRQEMGNHVKGTAHKELPAHAHSFFMHDSTPWNVLVISMILCDYDIIDSGDQQYQNLGPAFQMIEMPASCKAILLKGLFQDAENVVIPLNSLRKLTGVDQEICSMSKFISVAKDSGFLWTPNAQPKLLKRVHKCGQSPKLSTILVSNTPWQQVSDAFRKVFMAPTPNDIKFPCNSMGEQIIVHLDSETPMPDGALEGAISFTHYLEMQKCPYTIKQVTSSVFVDGLKDPHVKTMNKNKYLSEMMAATQEVFDLDDVNLKIPFLLVCDTKANLDKILRNLFKEQPFSAHSVVGGLLYTLLDFGGSMSFTDLIDTIVPIVVEHNQFNTSEKPDSNIHHLSIEYYVVCLMSTMLVACDLLLNCKSGSADGMRIIDAFPADLFRRGSFTFMCTDIHNQAWKFHTENRDGSYFDVKKVDSFKPRYPELNVSYWILFFARRQLAVGGHSTSLAGKSGADVQVLAQSYVCEIADTNASLYEEHMDRKVPTEQFSASLRNYATSLDDYVQMYSADGVFPDIIASQVPDMAVVAAQ